jgi:DNA-binding response OmpR family regulator
MTAHGRDISVLLVGHEPSLRDTYALLFEFAGYAAHSAAVEQLESAVKHTAFTVVLFDHTLSESQRRSAVQTVRMLAPQSKTVALHSSAKDCGADLIMDSREGPVEILARVGALLEGIPRKPITAVPDRIRRGAAKQ